MQGYSPPDDGESHGEKEMETEMETGIILVAVYGLGFPTLGVPFLGISITRIEIFWGLYWNPDPQKPKP